MNVNRKICMSFGNIRFMLIDNNLMHNVFDIEKDYHSFGFISSFDTTMGLYLHCNVIRCSLSYNKVILYGGIGKGIVSSSYLLVERSFH